VMPLLRHHDQEAISPRAIIAVATPAIDPVGFRGMRIPHPPHAQNLNVHAALVRIGKRG
jgi:hypothetical protein